MSESSAALGKTARNDVRETAAVSRKCQRDTKLYLAVYTRRENISSKAHVERGEPCYLVPPQNIMGIVPRSDSTFSSSTVLQLPT